MAAGVVTRNSAPDPRGMDAWGHYAVCPFKYIGPTVYAAGGDAQAAQVFKLGVVEYVEDFLGIPAAGTTAVIYHYDVTNAKMQAFQSTTGAPSALVEVADATDLSTFVGHSRAYGKG